MAISTIMIGLPSWPNGYIYGRYDEVYTYMQLIW